LSYLTLAQDKRPSRRTCPPQAPSGQMRTNQLGTQSAKGKRSDGWRKEFRRSGCQMVEAGK
jgi:hypothetical protein